MTDLVNKMMLVVILVLELSPLIILVLIQHWLLKSNTGWKHTILPLLFGIISIIATIVLTGHLINNPLVELDNLFFTIGLYLGLFNIPTAVLLLTNDIVSRKQKRRSEMIQLEVRDLN